MFPVVPADLSALSDDELNTLESEMVEAFNEAADDENTDVEVLETAADDIERIRTEQSTRADAANNRDEKVNSLRSRVNASTEGEGDEGEGEGDDAGEGEGDDDAEGEESGEDQNSTEDEGQESGSEGESESGEAEGGDGKSDASITASARRKNKSGGLSKLKKGAPARTRPRSESAGRGFGNVTANADVNGFAAGQRLGSIKDLAEALSSRQRTMGRGNGDNVPVATFHLDLPESRKLDEHMSAGQIQDKIDAFDQRGLAIVASGGLCAPTEGYYDQMIIAGSDRPVREALANFEATRGGIKFNPPPTLASITGGIGIVTAAQDAGGTTKSCFTVTCPAPTEVVISAIYSCITFGNMLSRTFPEQVEAWTKLMLATYARTAETYLLDQIAALSTPVTVQGLVGAGREIFARLGQAAAGYRSRNRMAPDAPLRVVLPAWVLELVRTDLARSVLGDPDRALSVANSQINSWFAVRNITPSWYLDSKTGGGQIIGSPTGGQAFGDGVTNATTTFTSATGTFTSADVGKTLVATGVPAGATIVSVQSATSVTLSIAATSTATNVSFTVGRTTISQYPTMVYAYLYAEGTFLHLDGGTLDIGLVRDSTLNANNQFQMFNEGFENVAKVGPDAVELRMALQPDGSSSASKAVTIPINS